MSLLAECDVCGNQHRVKDDWAGRDIPCKACGVGFRVPADTFITPERYQETDGVLRPREKPPGPDYLAWLTATAVLSAMIGGIGGVLWLGYATFVTGRPAFVAANGAAPDVRRPFAFPDAAAALAPPRAAERPRLPDNGLPMPETRRRLHEEMERVRERQRQRLEELRARSSPQLPGRLVPLEGQTP